MIQYIAEGVKLPALQKQKINSWIKATAAYYDKKVGEKAYLLMSALSVILCV